MSAPGRLATLDDWLGWLETLHPKAIDLSLARISAVLEALSLEKPPYRVVAVGGTNGKGSCVTYLESIYRAAGLRVGAFTSPHLWRFNERIRVDRAWATDAELIRAFEAIEAARGRITLSYFESSAVAALVHFARSGVEVAILEVGLGGRLDAVNAVDPDASLIVSIGLDHTEWLGHDRDSIAYEKAGILRAGKPAVIAESDPPATLVEEAGKRRAKTSWIGREFSFEPAGEEWTYTGPNERRLRLPRPAFGGGEQYVNAAACVALVDSLAEFLPVDDTAIVRGIAEARLEGRLDARSIDGVEWIFDVAHNTQAVRFLAHRISGAFAGRTIAVFGAMADKDLDGVLGPFAAAVDAWYLARVDSPRTAEPGDVAARLAGLGARGAIHCCDDVAAAAARARGEAGLADRVCVFGSFYTVGPAMEALGLYSAPLGGGSQVP